MIGLVRSEFLKIRTTHVWWAMILGMVGVTGVALAINTFVANAALNGENTDDPSITGDPVSLAANVYTSGQFLGLLLAMIMGVLVVTNEYFHQTATPTFLTTPRRARVIAAKVVNALIWGAALAACATVVSVVVGLLFYSAKGAENHLADADVVKSILLNVMAFGIWAIFGLGLGTLLRNQIVSVVIALVLYLIAESALTAALFFLSQRFEQEWIAKVYYYLPSGASKVMTTVGDTADAPDWWVGALTLLAYGVVAGGIGTLITNRRDIS